MESSWNSIFQHTGVSACLMSIQKQEIISGKKAGKTKQMRTTPTDSKVPNSRPDSRKGHKQQSNLNTGIDKF